MRVTYCSNCGKETGHQRKLGFGTFFAVVLTAGFWLLALPFYPKRCQICGETIGNFIPAEPADQKTCPQCAETVKRAAKLCRFCGAQL